MVKLPKDFVDKYLARLVKRGNGIGGNLKFKGHYGFRCLSPDRKIILWENEFDNIIVNEGLNYIIDNGLGASLYLGLLGSSPSPAAGWTSTEVAAADFVDYDEANLQLWNNAGAASQSITNNANKAEFTVSTNGSTIGGGFLITTNAKAPSGTVISAGAFSLGDETANAGSVIQVALTISAADA